MKKIAAFLLSAFMAVSLAVSGADGNADAQDGSLPVLAENYIGADFSDGQTAYQVDKAISETVNTFECIIRMDKNEYTSTYTSVIFGNFQWENAMTGNNKYTNWEVDNNGRVRINWMNSIIVFPKTDVRTNKWTHIAVVRDKTDENFKLYINGKREEVSKTYIAGEAKDNFYKHRIGSDIRETGNVRKQGFCGEIAQITCYASSRSASEIVFDYDNAEKLSYDLCGNDLIFNTRLRQGDKVVYDTSASCNHARMQTVDYWYDGQLYDVADYSFSVIGDTQKWSRGNDDAIDKVINWTLENKDERKIANISFMGDLTDGKVAEYDWEIEREWQVCSSRIRSLEGKIPYYFVPGNHDYPKDAQRRDLTLFNKYFPYAEQAAHVNFGGAYNEGETQNIYHTQIICGIPYVFISLEFGPPRSVCDWMARVIKSHPQHRVVVITHGFLDWSGEMYKDETWLSGVWYFSRYGYEATSAETLWYDYLSKYDNVFMILNGHSMMETVAYKPLKGEHGNTVMALRVDSSGIVSYCLDPTIALIQMNESERKLYLNYFSPEKNMLFNYQNQMVIDFNGFTEYTADYYKAQ